MIFIFIVKQFFGFLFMYSIYRKLAVYYLIKYLIIFNIFRYNNRNFKFI
jgi:hypothetical protein